MEIRRKAIHRRKEEGACLYQMTAEDDINIPDSKEDAGRIVLKKGEIQTEEIRVSEGKVLVSGKLKVNLLYTTEKGAVLAENMEVALPIEEMIRLPEANPGLHVNVKWEIEDLNVSLIHSRKINIRALLSAYVTAGNIGDWEVAIDCIGQNLEKRYEIIEPLRLMLCKKDACRMKEEVLLPANKPNIRKILWSNLEIRGLQLLVEEEKIRIKGEWNAFLLYAAEEEERFVWFETTLPYEGELPCAGARAKMLGNIRANIAESHIVVKPDYDGEERNLHLEAVLEIHPALYEEEPIQVLTDVYALDGEVEVQKEEQIYESLLTHNESQCRINEKIILEEEAMLLQLLTTQGTLSVEKVEIIEDGILVKGVLELQILFVSADDKEPLCGITKELPFTHHLEAKGIGKDCVYELQAGIVQLGATLTDARRLDVKAVLDIGCDVRRQHKLENIVKLTKKEDGLQANAPGIIGHIVSEGESLWEIAKKNRLTVQEIMEMNGLNREELQKGEKILLVKTAKG